MSMRVIAMAAPSVNHRTPIRNLKLGIGSSAMILLSESYPVCDDVSRDVHTALLEEAPCHLSRGDVLPVHKDVKVRSHLNCSYYDRCSGKGIWERQSAADRADGSKGGRE